MQDKIEEIKKQAEEKIKEIKIVFEYRRLIKKFTRIARTKSKNARQEK